MTVIINPGTEGNNHATAGNAVAIAERIKCEFLGSKFKRASHLDMRRGFFGFVFSKGDRSVVVHIPGDDPDVVCLGRPFQSRRLYVDGSSWFYGYAMGFISRNLGYPE